MSQFADAGQQLELHVGFPPNANGFSVSSPDPSSRAVSRTVTTSINPGDPNLKEITSFIERAAGTIAAAKQIQGKELSYNNINDTDAAYECVGEFEGSLIAPRIFCQNAGSEVSFPRPEFVGTRVVSECFLVR